MKEYHLKVNGHDYVITLKSLAGDRAEIEVDGEDYVVDIQSIQRKGSAKRRPLPSAQRGPAIHAAHVPPPPDMRPLGRADRVTAPIPGVIIEVLVKEGDAVAAGAALLKMEAMKMENVIAAPRAGKVARLHVKAGDTVSQGRELVELE
jgi:biotin carboxyl carrier protein